MDKVSGLKKILKNSFGYNKARIDCLSRLILGLLAVRTVNLKEISLGFVSQSQVDSRYRRLQRFFAQFQWDYTQFARWIFFWFFKKDQKVYLIVDRTNWYWGKSKINVLMLSVAYEGLSIPLMWQMLNKAGNASAKEHSEIIGRYVQLFGKSNILGILGDREFASGKLFQYLRTYSIPFYLRLKEDANVCWKKQKIFSAKKIFCHLNVKQTCQFGAAVFVYGHKVYLSASRSEKGELMIVATLLPCKNAIPTYLRRWEIETLFQSLKGRGFHFEDTHITQLQRLSSLIAVLTIAFCWAHKVGEWKALKKPIRFKQFRRQKRPQYTFFRYGLDLIRDILLNVTSPAKPSFSFILKLFPQLHPGESS